MTNRKHPTNLFYLWNKSLYRYALYDPSCPRYAEALLQQQYDQNCIANPLYDSGCPGYATAYLNQQCTINPLYSSSWRLYRRILYTTMGPWILELRCDEYFDLQCKKDPLYDITCRLLISINSAYLIHDKCRICSTHESQDPIAMNDGTFGDGIVDNNLHCLCTPLLIM